MFGFKKKHCALCQNKDVINVGKPLRYLCQTHLIETYKSKYIAHGGRKIIIPPAKTVDKYSSYQFETVSGLMSYGLSLADIVPVTSLFSNLPSVACYIMQSSYDAKDMLDIDQLIGANWTEKSSEEAVSSILYDLPAYMKSGGVALPPDGTEDVIFYPLRS